MNIPFVYVNMPSIVTDMPYADYSAVDAVRASDLTELAKSASKCKWRMDHRDHGSTASMLKGTLLHTMLLEPEKLDERFAVAPAEWNKNAKAWKDWAAKQGDKILLKPSEHHAANEAATAYLTKPRIKRLFGKGENEVSAFWEMSPESSVKPGIPRMCKARADRRIKGRKGWVLVDIKTTTDCSPRAFRKTMGNFRYPLSAGWYSIGFEAVTGDPHIDFFYVVLERDPPWRARAYRLSDESHDMGRKEAEYMFEKYCHHAAEGIWDDPWDGSTKVEEIGYSDWYRPVWEEVL